MPDPFHSCTSYSPPIPTSLPLQYLHFFFGSRKSCEIFCCCRQLVSSESERGEEESRGDGQQVGSWHIAGHRVMDGTGIAARRVASLGISLDINIFITSLSLVCLFPFVSVLSRSDATDVDTLGRLEWLPQRPLPDGTLCLGTNSN